MTFGWMLDAGSLTQMLSKVLRPASGVRRPAWKLTQTLTLLLCSTGAVASEADQGAVGIAAADILTVLAGLGLVLAVIAGCAWFIKRMGGVQGGNNGAIKIITVLPLGTRERLALVEVGGQQLLLGITAQQITTLHSFDEPVVEAADLKNNSEFAQKLHQLMSRS